MKNLIITIFLFLSALINNLIAQEVITSKHNLDKISNKKDSFYNKPLKYFLNNLKIDISSLSYQKECESNPNQIILRFDERLEYNKMRSNKIIPARIIIQFVPDKDTQNIFKHLNNLGIVEDRDDIKDFIKKIENIKIFMIYGYNEHQIDK